MGGCCRRRQAAAAAAEAATRLAWPGMQACHPLRQVVHASVHIATDVCQPCAVASVQVEADCCRRQRRRRRRRRPELLSLWLLALVNLKRLELV